MARMTLGLWSIIGFTLTLLAWAPDVRADIVFINLNGGVTEIPAAQSVAAQNGEKVYVLPQRPPQSYPEYYDTKLLTRELLELAKRGVRPRAMVVSGHHSKNEGFWGDNGEASLYYIGKILPQPGQPDHQDAQEFFASLQSVYLWGCYTGQLGNAYKILTGQNAAFPNVKYVVGFGEKGPLNTDPLSGVMLKDVMLKETMLRSASAEDAFFLLTTIPSYRQKDLLVHKGTTLVSQIGTMTQSEFIASCQYENRRESLKNSIQLIWDYYWDRSGPIPQNTSKSPLRGAYEDLQRNNFCLKMGAVDFSKEFGEIPVPSDVIRLIFYKNIIRNFARLYSSHLAYADKELEFHGIKGLGFLTKIDEVDRSEVMRRLESAHQQVAQKYKSKTNQELYAKYIYLNGILDDIEEVVYPNGEYVPLRWIDPNSTSWTEFEYFSQFEKGKATAKNKAASLVTQ